MSSKSTSLKISDKFKSFTETLPDKTLAVTSTSPRFILDLNYEEAFDVEILQFISDPNNKENIESFCWAFPSLIESNSEQTIDFDVEGALYYDNIVEYQGYFFLLNSETLNILVTNNFESFPFTIKNSIAKPLGNSKEVPFLLVEKTSGTLYVITTQVFLKYDLKDAILRIQRKSQLANLETSASQNYVKSGNIAQAKINPNTHNIYILGDGKINVYAPNNQGNLEAYSTLSCSTIGSTQPSDFAFYLNYMFLLDHNFGFYVLDVSELSFKYTGQKYPVSNGDFITVIDNSLNIARNDVDPILTEFIINTNGESLRIFHNRDTTLDDTVEDMISDGNFIFLISGFINTVAKHSIPNAGEKDDEIDYLVNDWISWGAKAMVSIPGDGESQVIVISDEYIQNFTFTFENPQLYCDVGDVPNGKYTYQLEATLPTCEAKMDNPTQSNFESVCIFKENINLFVGEDNSNIGDTNELESMLQKLFFGLCFMGFIVLILLFCTRRYKNQYRRLETEYQRLKVEPGSSDKWTDKPHTDPTSGDKGSSSFGAQEKPHEDQGGAFDMRPLDVNKIYGEEKENPF